jgi:WD40 repeat protein
VTNERLNKAALRRIAPEVRARMGKNGEQLDRAVETVAEDGRANLARVLEAVYPGEEVKRAMANLRQLRLEVKEAAEKAGVRLALAGDGKTRTPTDERDVWFEGDDLLMEGTERWVRPNLGGVDRYTPLTAQKLGPILLYVVYAERDEADATKLLEALEPHFRNAGMETWTHKDVLPGEDPAEQRALARARSDLTLQFLSPEFIAAKLDSERTGRVVPVLLHPLADEPQDMEVFRYRDKSFDKSNVRDFALELFRLLRARLEKSEAEASCQLPQGVRAKPAMGDWSNEGDIRALARQEAHFVDNPARPFSFEREIDPREPVTNRCDALTFLHEWLMDPSAPRYCALLGELGMGKTTTAKEFAKRLWERRASGENVPAAIFLDLRSVGDVATSDPDLDEIVARILKRDWKGGPRSQPPEPWEIYELVEDGALVIFDGLDEVLVHLTPSQGQAFTRQLFRIAPSDARRERSPVAGRLLITCRTHYFRTEKEQSAHFTLEDRDSIRAESYRALVLLPFGEQQIRTYLKNSLPDRDVNQAYEFIKSVHNLPELAERPYTLSLITRQFARLEEWKAAGKAVTGLTLYRFVVEEWLLRDGGKHQFHPEHKQMLMEHVAAELLRSGARTWPAGQLEDWLMGFLDAHRRVAAHYDGVKRDLLKEDLRTATFLVRDENGDQFRFAHSSLQEYFLAAYLRRALEEAAPANWALRGVSRETLDFLGQSLQEQPSDAARRGLGLLRDAYLPLASELAFRYVLLAQARGYPAPDAVRFQLPGADLWELEVDHPGPGLLDLRNLNLKGARVANSFWRRCRLSGADFSGADAARGEWHDCDLSGSRWNGSDLEASMFRRCGFAYADFSDARIYRAKWLRCSGAGIPKPAWHSAQAVELRLQIGHHGFLGRCCWSPDGRRLLSCSADKTLKIWDAATGDCLLSLTDHENSVWGSAWSPDGRRVLSASDDRTLKIWDAVSGDCLLTLSGHEHRVIGCAWSPDCRRVLSTSEDRTLKIWDSCSGGCLLTLSGHEHSVFGCAWSPDGTRVLSSSEDKTLKIWDAVSGDCILTLSGHAGSVFACDWSPDGRRVLSGSEDKTLKVWDVVSGDCLLTLSGHEQRVCSCAWSPDGHRVLSAGDVETVRIWDAISGDCLLVISDPAVLIQVCAWSPDGRRVLSTASDGGLKTWNAVRGDRLLTVTGHSSYVSGCAWSPDSRRLLSASGQALRIWRADSGDCVLTLAGHSDHISSCTWSPDGCRVLSASDDTTLKIWDADSGDCLVTLAGHSRPASSCAWSPDGRRVLSAYHDRTLRIWDVDSRDCRLLAVSTPPLLVNGSAWSPPLGSGAWSPDGHRVLTRFAAGGLRIWDADSGDCLVTLADGGSNPIGCQAWSPDGGRILCGFGDGTVKILNADSGDCLLSFSGGTGAASSCAWSPDGHRVLSTSYAYALKVWDADSGRCLLTQSGAPGSAFGCAWSGDGRRVSACSGDGSVRIFEAATLAEIGPRLYHLHPPHSNPTWAAFDPVRKRVLGYGEDAWRSVGCVIPDETGIPMWLPIEALTTDGDG